MFNGSDFNLKENNFSFSNKSSDFFNAGDLIGQAVGQPVEINTKVYQISNESFQKLLNHTYDNNEIQKFIDARNSKWAGSCYGMSAVMDIMFSRSENLPISKIFKSDKYNNDSAVYDLPKPKESIEMEDLVNYYHLSMNFNYINDRNYESCWKIKDNYSVSLNDLINEINNTDSPVMATITHAYYNDSKYET